MSLTVVADTGALLSLALSGLLPRCKKEFRIVIGNRIHEELQEVSKVKDDLGDAALVVLDSIEVVKAKHNHLKGEDEAFELLKELNADLLISDDIKFVRKNEDNKKIAFSVILLGVLLEQDKLSKEEFSKALNRIFEKRKWQENLIYLVAKYIIQNY